MPGAGPSTAFTGKGEDMMMHHPVPPRSSCRGRPEKMVTIGTMLERFQDTTACSTTADNVC